MTFCQIRIQRERVFYRQFGILIQLFLVGPRREEVRLDAIGPGQLSIGGGKAGICLDDLLEHSDRAFVVLPIFTAGVEFAA